MLSNSLHGFFILYIVPVTVIMFLFFVSFGMIIAVLNFFSRYLAIYNRSAKILVLANAYSLPYIYIAFMGEKHHSLSSINRLGYFSTKNICLR